MQIVRDNVPRCVSLAIAVGLLVGLIILGLGLGGDSPSRSLAAANAKEAAQRTYWLLVNVPQHGDALGEPSAPVTLQFFGDLECPESRIFTLGDLPLLIRHWVRGGKLRIEYHSTKTDTHSTEDFERQQKAALAAGMQGKLWNYVDLFYREQGVEFTRYATEAFVEHLASQAGLNMGEWTLDRTNDHLGNRLNADARTGVANGLISTPSFLIGRTGQTPRPLRHFSVVSPQAFDEAIEGLLRT